MRIRQHVQEFAILRVESARCGWRGMVGRRCAPDTTLQKQMDNVPIT